MAKAERRTYLAEHGYIDAALQRVIAAVQAGDDAATKLLQSRWVRLR
jgi:hypothetical protein